MDPFCGRGTTVLEANQQNRIGYLISRFQSLISTFLGLSKNPKEGGVLEEFELNMDRLKKTMQEIEPKWSIFTKWYMILSNDETGENTPSLIEKGKRRGLMEAYNKKWIAFGMALMLPRIISAK